MKQSAEDWPPSLTSPKPNPEPQIVDDSSKNLLPLRKLYIVMHCAEPCSLQLGEHWFAFSFELAKFTTVRPGRDCEIGDVSLRVVNGRRLIFVVGLAPARDLAKHAWLPFL